jgi:hypothetical protein
MRVLRLPLGTSQIEALGDTTFSRNPKAPQPARHAIHHRRGPAYEVACARIVLAEARLQNIWRQLANTALPAWLRFRKGKMRLQIQNVPHALNFVAIENLRLPPIAIDQGNRMRVALGSQLRSMLMIGARPTPPATKTMAPGPLLGRVKLP